MAVVPIRNLLPDQRWGTFGATEPTYEHVGFAPEDDDASAHIIGNGDILVEYRDLSGTREVLTMRVPRDVQVTTF